jgi:hypothetical protein
MKNVVVCSHCGKENDYYNLNCSECKAYIRGHVSNIDMWHTFSQLSESPAEAFKNIVFSDHKNFVIPLVLVIAFKFLFNILFFAPYISRPGNVFNNFIPNYIITSVSLFALLLVISFLLKFIIKLLGGNGRMKDYFAILVFSLIFYIVGSVVLYPIEFIAFGSYLHSISPTPFFIKPTIAYILSGTEILFAVWSVFLLIKGLYVQTKSKLFSVIAGLVINALYFVMMYAGSILLFKVR